MRRRMLGCDSAARRRSGESRRRASVRQFFIERVFEFDHE